MSEVSVRDRQDASSEAQSRAKGLSIGWTAFSYLLSGMAAYGGIGWLVGRALARPNLGQVPAAFLMLAFAYRLTGRRWPFVTIGLLCLASVLGIVLMPYAWVPAWSCCSGLP